MYYFLGLFFAFFSLYGAQSHQNTLLNTVNGATAFLKNIEKIQEDFDAMFALERERCDLESFQERQKSNQCKEVARQKLDKLFFITWNNIKKDYYTLKIQKKENNVRKIYDKIKIIFKKLQKQFEGK